ncbi:L,D-transpeptidase [Leifsonia sp. LS-T14]|uniref:L,D-transpeptidase family protein n=1 Tax=unclassified Leifsonia TaxID=2663824 RepID=UPI0035A5C98D
MSVPVDTPVYGDDFRTPIARIPAKNFLDEPTVVVPVRTRGAWTQVLTPSRRILPSQATAEHPAPAQTAAWLPTASLLPFGAIPNRIVVSVSRQTLVITTAAGVPTRTFPVGVGTTQTPTPTGVTGYLQARYLDPAQDQTKHRIQLTSLHATGADEPYGGADGGLIGLHFQQSATGAVSHGCLRLSGDAVDAIDALPLGTPIVIDK